MSPVDKDHDQLPGYADIEISASAERRALEVVYLELRELAARNGLKIEYQLTMTNPDDQSTT